MPLIRRRLLAAAGMMLLMFILRILSSDMLLHVPDATHCLWYGYYVSFTFIPMFSLFAAFCVGQELPHRSLLESVIFVCSLALCAAALTNDLHHAVFAPKAGVLTSGVHVYGWLYNVIVGWIIVLSLSAFLLLLHRSRVVESRRRWYLVPLTGVLAVAVMLQMVLVGILEIGHFRFNVQEAYCLLFITLIEFYISAGLIPSNTGYDALLQHSPISLELQDHAGKTVFRSAQTAPTDDALFRERRAPIAGGSVVWKEDLSALYRKNLSLEEAIDTIESENMLIEEENAVRENRLRYEAQNRLYDQIAVAVRPQVLELETQLDESAPADTLQARLRRSVVLGAFVKRFGNQTLLAHENETLSSQELLLCVRESLEYLSLSGVTCDVRAANERYFSAALTLLGYTLFETVVEACYSRLSACEVTLAPQNAVLEIAVDAPPPTLSGWRKDELCALGATVDVYARDETYFVRLRCTAGEVSA